MSDIGNNSGSAASGSTPLAPPGNPTAAPSVESNWWKRKWKGVPRWVFIAAAVVLLIGAATSGGKKDSESTGSTGATEASTPPIATESSAGVPTTLPEATTTLATTTTVAPTTTLPETIVFSGRGDDVIDLGEGNARYVVRSTHDGSSNFVVEALDEGLEMVDLIVNEIGDYSGTNVMNIYGDASETRYLQITADGPWTVELLAIEQLPTVADSFDGTGPTVVVYTGDGGVVTINHTGRSNFAVQVVSGEGTDLLVNEIGNYSGRQPMPGGPALVAIMADGQWSFSFG